MGVVDMISIFVDGRVITQQIEVAFFSKADEQF
jgi:hypothetical protein